MCLIYAMQRIPNENKIFSKFCFSLFDCWKSQWNEFRICIYKVKLLREKFFFCLLLTSIYFQTCVQLCCFLHRFCKFLFFFFASILSLKAVSTFLCFFVFCVSFFFLKKNSSFYKKLIIRILRYDVSTLETENFYFHHFEMYFLCRLCWVV